MLQLCKKSLTCSECNSAWVSSQEHSYSSQFTSCRKGEAGGGILRVRERKYRAGAKEKSILLREMSGFL